MSENITHDELYDNENDDDIIEVIENKCISIDSTPIDTSLIRNKNLTPSCIVILMYIESFRYHGEKITLREVEEHFCKYRHLTPKKFKRLIQDAKNAGYLKEFDDVIM